MLPRSIEWRIPISVCWGYDQGPVTALIRIWTMSGLAKNARPNASDLDRTMRWIWCMGDIAFNKLTTAKVLRGSGIKKYLAVAGCLLDHRRCDRRGVTKASLADLKGGIQALE